MAWLYTARYLLFLIFVSVTVLALEEVGNEVGEEVGEEVGNEVGEGSDNIESVIDWAEVDNKLILDSLRIDHRDHTYADINSYRTLYQSLHLTVDMEDRTLSGFVETTFVKIKPSWMMSKFSSVGTGLVLDIGPHVTVTEVEHVETGEKLEFTTSCVDKHVVSVLQCALQINDPMESVGQFKLRIHYSVTDKTSSLHFIPPLQTHSKDKYFLVSNTQPSNARGWIPCQDTPALKFPYHATIRVKEPFTVLMSAIVTTTSTDESGWATVGFRQEIPTPPYLIAITVADIVSVDVRGEGLGTDAGLAVPPIRVWGEKSLMEKVGPSGILDLIPRMMDICERKYGRYEWLRYDIVLNPPGYMFRGMEFPAMNYISSTVLNFNDLTGPNYIFSNIIAHEMIHSWFGNLVTPKYAGDAWLAEGITSFEELELMEEYYENPEVGKFLRKDRYTSLKKTLESYTGASAKYKILTPYLFEDHPFHGFTYIHYNKGSLFLEYLANHTSREKVDQGLRSYLDSHRYQSVDTADFVHMLYQQFGFESAKDIEREIFVWLERPSTKVPVKLYQSEIFEECSEIYKILTRSKRNRTVSWKLKDIAEAYDHRTGLLGDKAGHVHSQMMIVLERMKTVINRANMTETRLKNWKILLNRLDKTFKFSQKTESDPEMFAKWASIALRFNHTSTMSAAPVFFAENARLELVFSLLDAPVDFRLRGVFANILRTSYDTSRYPGYIGSLLTSYAEYFIGFYEP